MNTAIGVVFVAAAFGLFFFGGVFMHGYDEGVMRMRQLHGEQLVLGIGMVAFAVAAIFVLTRGRRR